MAAIDPLATVIWDLSDSAGAVPIGRSTRLGVRYAVGCTYKYLNAGPGRPVTCMSATRTGCASPIQGWFGQDDQFAMEQSYAPAPGITRFMAGTPSILVLAAIEESVRISAEARIEALRAKSIAQTETDHRFTTSGSPLGLEVGSPRDPTRRGSHVALNHPEAWPICRALIERADVIPDYRGPEHGAARRRADVYALRRCVGRDGAAARPGRTGCPP